MDDIFGEITDTLFDEKIVLDEEYQPDTIVEREDEIEAYRSAFKDVLFGRNPPNVFAYGKTGVGKSAVTNYVLEALDQEARHRAEADELHILVHNCNNDSAYGALRTFINTLRSNDADPFPKKGLSIADALSEFYAELDARGGTFLIVLDEIDHLNDLDSLLYELPRARSNGYLEDARIGIVGISNNYTFRDSLSPKVRDTLMEREISFSPYDADELRTILSHRADRAFVDGACDQSAIAKAAALAARDTGSARQAIDLLRIGGEIAEERSDSVVTDEHVDSARDRVERGRAKDKICDQTIHGQLVLEAIAQLDSRGETPARTKVIQSTYEDIADRWGYDPLSSLKSIQNHLSDLTMLGFLQRYECNDGRSGGYYYEYELTISADAVLDVREEIEEQDV